jgi:hypothetical protein
MTAQVSEAELLEWVPVRFDDVDDPLATPEPSKAALVELESGDYVVLYYGKDSGQLTVEIPETTSDSSELIASFFSEVPLPLSRVLWRRADTHLPKRAKRSARRVALPRTRK